MSKRIGGRTSAGLNHPAISAMYRVIDLKEELREDFMRDWLKDERDLMEKCAEVEGAKTFQAWYGDDNNIPAFGKTSHRVSLLQAHYEALKVTHATEFYWLEVEKQEANHCIAIEGRQSFCEWWDGDNFPENTTPKERVELIRKRIDNFLTNDGTVQVQERLRVIQQALITKKATNISEAVKEMAELGNHIQDVGVEIQGEKGDEA